MKVTLTIEMELDGSVLTAYEAMTKIDQALTEISAIEIVKSCTTDFEGSFSLVKIPPAPDPQKPKTKHNIIL